MTGNQHFACWSTGHFMPWRPARAPRSLDRFGGRLVLCDALAEASTEKPELLIDMATLTGAAHGALGPELAALFCNDEPLAQGLLDAAQAEEDPMWRMPLWRPYRSKVADINNVSESPHAGAVTAALYLQDLSTPISRGRISM